MGIIGVRGACARVIDIRLVLFSYRGSQQLQLHLDRFIMEVIEEVLEKLISIINAVAVLSDDPNHGRARLIVIKGSS